MNGNRDADESQRQPSYDGTREHQEGAAEEQQPSDNGGDDGRDLSAQNSLIGDLSRSERFAFWTLVATAALALGTFILALATVDMAGSTRQLADLAKQQAKDTQDALTTARRQASAAEFANRLASAPVVIVNQINLSLPTPDVDYTASFGIINIGKTSAQDVKAQAQLYILNELIEPPSTPSCANCNSALLFPTQGLQSNGLSYEATLPAIKLSQHVIDMLKGGTDILYLVGRVDYKDVDGRTHHISICNFLHGSQSKSGPCASGNEVD